MEIIWSKISSGSINLSRNAVLLGQAKGLSLPVFAWSQLAINDSSDALSAQFSSKTSNAFSLYVTSVARNFWLTRLGRVCAIYSSTHLTVFSFS